MLQGGVGISGAPARQTLDPLPRPLQTQLRYVRQPVLPSGSFRVEGDQVEFLLVSDLLLLISEDEHI